MSKLVKIINIEVNPTLTVRQATDPKLVEEYVEVFDQLPPITVFDIGKGHKVLADGFHRISAAKKLGKTIIGAEVRKGTLSEAKHYAAVANLRHGKRLTAEEKANAIFTLHRLHPTWQGKRIAEETGMGQRMTYSLLQAYKLRQKFKGTTLTNFALAAVASVPEREQEKLVKVAERKGWTVQEIEAATRNLKDKTVTEKFKKDLLNGKGEPVSFRKGQAQVLPDTVNRVVQMAKATDNRTALWAVISGITRVSAQYEAEELLEGLARKDLEYLQGELPRRIDYIREVMQEVDAALHRQIRAVK